MIRYYNGEQFLGYLVGKCPKTGKPVLVDDGMNYYTPRVITHKVVGETILDERTQPPLEQGRNTHCEDIELFYEVRPTLT